jgi:hypothetical protein
MTRSWALFGSRMLRKLVASIDFCSAVSPSSQPVAVADRLAFANRDSCRDCSGGCGGDCFQNHKFMGVIHKFSRTCGVSLLALLVLGSAGCKVDRPIHPLRLEGFPGEAVVSDLFPLRDGMSWTFQDRLNPDADPLVFTVKKKGLNTYVLDGGANTGPLELAWEDGFLEFRRDGEALDRILKFPGNAGDTWVINDAIFTIFGYDEIEVLGEKKRALVVAADRRRIRELGWFVPGMGWVRIRTERRGKVLHDATLIRHDPGRMN